MKFRVILLFTLLIAACSPTAEPEPTAQVAQIEPTNTQPAPTDTAEPPPTEPPPTETAPPPTATAEPTETAPPPTATTAPTATAVPFTTFTTPTDLQERLTLASEEPVIEGESGNRYLNGGAVIFHDGEFHAFSNFFNTWPGETVSYYYKSADGVAWERVQEEPIFTIEDVPLQGRGALALSGLVQPDGTWVLYYHTFTAFSSPGFIGRATATNPLGPWVFDETAVLSPGSEGEWDDTQVMRVNVLPLDEGYVMYYAGVNQRGNSSIGMAFSDDGIAWAKHDDPTTTEPPYAESDPIMQPALDWEGSMLGRPEVVQTAEGWVMLYEGDGKSRTGIAISTDGVQFDRYEQNPILTREEMVRGNSFFQGALFHQDDTFYYLIESGGAGGTDIYLYTITGSLLE